MSFGPATKDGIARLECEGKGAARGSGSRLKLTKTRREPRFEVDRDVVPEIDRRALPRLFVRGGEREMRLLPVEFEISNAKGTDFAAAAAGRPENAIDERSLASAGAAALRGANRLYANTA